MIFLMTVFSYLISRCGFFFARVRGESMYPTLLDGDLCICRTAKRVSVGDIVVFAHINKILIKRVKEEIKLIGTPSSSIYYVTGDNWRNSLDSSRIGMISQDQILGSTLFVLLKRGFFWKLTCMKRLRVQA